MKFFGASAIIVLTFATLTSAYLGRLLENDLKLIWECVVEHNISSLSSFDIEFEAYGKFAFDNTTGHCFVKCVVEKYGLLDNDNQFKLESVENLFQRENGKLFNKDRLPDAVKCAKSVNEETFDNTCAHAYRGVECFFAELKELVIKSDPVFKYQIECGIELKLSSSELIKQLELKSDRNPEYNCFGKCLMEKLGVLEENNNFNVKKYYDVVGESEEEYPSGEDLVKFEKCTNNSPQQEDENDCERAIRVLECITDTIETFE